MLPQNYRKQAMEACHDDIGHLGLERSLDLLKDRFTGQECPPTWNIIYKHVIDVYALRVNHRKQNYIPLL